MNTKEKEGLENTLIREIAYAKTQDLPSATGHIITAINWMEGRVAELENQLNEEYLESMNLRTSGK